MTKLFRSPIFWVSSVVASIGFIFFTIRFFSSAFPIVHIDLKIDRSQALQKANELAEKYGWGPTDYQQAIQFSTDTPAKTFIELEGGGVSAFVKMIDDNVYIPYTWDIRHFKEFEQRETEISFTPDGTPYGFLEKLSENMPGASLTSQEARTIAETTATRDWNIQFSDYKLVEAPKEILPSERTDHTFIYERPEIKISEGLFRLRLIVSGDKLSGLSHYIKIPEEFQLRYQEMRSSNESLASAASMLMILLYLIGGCIIGLVFLARQRFLLWKIPLILALIISFLELLTRINQLPLLWLYYDTALPSSGFLLTNALHFLYSFAYSVLLLTIIFMAAESLSRKAFGNHVQLWRVWTPHMASSPTVWAQTIGGYLLVTFYLAFGVAFYFFTRRFLGWWVPADELINPNILATYLPWLSPLVDALIAGFKEECQFRAIPLACAALIGQRLGQRRLWIASAFIIQAIIFGAVHANYAAQPAYARLVEIFVPSFVWGGIYLAFGLLPAIISHVTVDIVWMTLPLFLSSAPGAWINQLLVVMCAIIPFIILFVARLRAGAWYQPTTHDYNKGWQAPAAIADKITESIKQTFVSVNRKTLIAIVSVGFLSLVLWGATTQFTQNSLPITQSRAEAIDHARAALEKQGIVLDSSWTVLSAIHSSYEQNQEEAWQHKFIWQQGGKEAYKKLLSASYLTPAYWIIRFVKFQGGVSERAEEYQFFIAGNNVVISANHRVPESYKGAQLSEQEARTLAHASLHSLFNLNAATLDEISATDYKHQARKDWFFIFSNKEIYPLKEGQARVSIAIAGDRIAFGYRFIHVPEDWLRTERSKQNFKDVLTSLCTALLYALFILGIFVARTTPLFYIKSFIFLFLGIFLFFALTILNSAPNIIATFNTTEPFSHQLLTTYGAFFIQLLVKAALYALVLFAVSYWRSQRHIKSRSTMIVLGIVSGTILASFIALLNFFRPSLNPLWADFSPLSAQFPMIAVITSYTGKFLALSLIFLVLFIAVETLTHFWHRTKILGLSLIIFSGLLLTGFQGIDSIWFWFISGIAIGAVMALVYQFLVRLDYAMIPIATGTLSICLLIQQLFFGAFPAIIPGALVASCIIALGAYYWSHCLQKN